MNDISAFDVNTISLYAARLPFHAQQALQGAAGYASKFIEQHSSLCGDDMATLLLASGKIEWLLKVTRSELSHRFSESDIVTLLNCFQGALFFPDQFQSLASDLCDDLGIELDHYETSPEAALVKKLRELTPSQRVALADALEQAWHRGSENNQALPDFMAGIGIVLL